MTREELRHCEGFTVEHTLEGREAIARLSLITSPEGPALIEPRAKDGSWSGARFPPMILSDAEIESLRPNGDGVLSSTIRVSMEIPGDRLYEYPDPRTPQSEG